MTTTADTAIQDENTNGNRTEMIDKDHGLVDLNKNPEPAGDGEGGNISESDGARAAIYAKHAEKRKEQLGTTEPVVTADPDEEVTVKVNGRERQVPRSKIDAAGGIEPYQKNAAASEILNQASAEARRVREQTDALAIRERDIAEREKRLSQASANPAPASELPADAGALKTLARQYHDAMIDGDLDKADELLLRLSAAPSATAINPEEIATRAVQRAREELTADDRRKAAERFEADRLEAVAEFPTKYKDLASNPDAHGLVDAKTLEVHREHPEWSAKAIIDEAATRVRNLIRSVSTPTANSTQEKLEAKRNLTQISGGSARTVPRPAPRPQTNSEYVGDLRKQRGLDT